MTALAAAPDHACRHCGAKMEGVDPYCCHGCEMAAAIISDAGLDRYYAERAAPGPRPEGGPSGLARITPDVREDGLAELRFRVDGIRCASCVWVTERVLAGTDGVSDAHVAYGSGRAVVVFDPAKVAPDALDARLSALGYRARPRESAGADVDRDLLLRLGVAAFAAMNIMSLSAATYAGWLDGMDERFAALIRWAELLLATPAALWSAAPFFSGAIAGIRSRTWTMDQPIALGIAVMYSHAFVGTLIGVDGWLDSLGMLVALLLAGRMLEARGRRQSREAAESLAAQLPRTARRVAADGTVSAVDADALAIGDEIVLGAGEEIAADAIVIDGHGTVRMALLTGESEPASVGVDDRLVAGGIVADGGLRARVTAVGGNTVLGRMADELRDATDRPHAASLTARLAPTFTAATLVAASLTFVGWALRAGPTVAIGPTVAVLVVACPCALALAEPLAIAAGLGAAARRGLLIRNGDALLRLADVDMVALDKTGTVTGGAPVVAEAADAVLRIAAGLERFSVHPIAKAIVDAAQERGIAFPDARDLEEVAGKGISGVIDGHRFWLRSGGAGMVRLWGPDGMVGEIALRDLPRGDAAATLAALRAEKTRLVLLTGDHAGVAHKIAREAGIADVHAGVDPFGKAAFVKARAVEGHKVLFVGDGLNDGPALTAAHVGIAMGSGAAPALLAADGVVTGDRLGPVVAGLRAGHAARAAIRRNIVRSITYNTLAVSAAALGYVNPLVAALLMPLSSGLVIWGALGVERRVAREEAAWTR